MLDDNWPSRRTGEGLGAEVCANYLAYRRDFRRLGSRGEIGIDNAVLKGEGSAAMGDWTYTRTCPCGCRAQYAWSIASLVLMGGGV